jgi:hypothetical protein
MKKYTDTNLPDLDRHALDADPDPDLAKSCGSDRIPIHNTNQALVYKQRKQLLALLIPFFCCYVAVSVADLDPSDPYVFGPPGSRSIS